MSYPSAECIRQRLSYDPLTGVFVWVATNKYHPRLTGVEAGCVSPKGYRWIKLGGHAYAAHRLAWILMAGELPHSIDHINGIRDDNRWSNLRAAGPEINAKNHGRTINGSNLPIGVKRTREGRYQARVTCDNRVHHLGTFDTAEIASAAYLKARLRLFGQYDRRASA